MATAWGSSWGSAWGSAWGIAAGPWGSSWGSAWGDGWAISSAVVLVVADSGHDHAADAAALTQANILAIAEATHDHSSDGIGYFVIPELRLAGTLTGQSGPVTETDVQVAVFAGTNIYDAVPVLQSSAVSISAGQIAIRHALFKYEQLGGDYLIVFYKPGTARQGGGPHPATVADANA